MSRATLAICLIAAVCPTAWAEDEQPKVLQAVVVTADDEQISTQITGISDGKLELATTPPRSIPLADVSRIDVGQVIATAAPAGTDLAWIGQENHDLVQVGGASGGNGIQDLRLHATSLRPVGLKQITVVCRFPRQLRVWRLDTSQSPHWRLAIARADLATEADLYLEPAAIDSFGQTFEVTYTYSDDITTKAAVKATTHTSDQIRLDRAARAGETTAKPTEKPSTGRDEVFLASACRLEGDVTEMTSESLTVRTSWKADIAIPLLHVQGIWFGNAAPPGARSDFEKQMASPAGQDVVFAVGPDQAAANIQAAVKGLADGKLNVSYQDAPRAISRERVLGVVFAAHPPLAPPSGAVQVFQFNAGDTLSGKWVALADGNLEIELPWNARLKVPAVHIGVVRVRGGKVTFLPDLEPIAVTQVPYFGRVIPWGRDSGFDGKPPLVRGKQPMRSLSMHSKCVLSYALDGQYDKFKATLGFDDSAGNRGRVACRVLVDGREAFAQADFRADAEPQPVELALAGAKQLTLEVDFGQGDDVGDRIVWVDPRLFRAEAK